jgi:hypothetical protein
LGTVMYEYKYPPNLTRYYVPCEKKNVYLVLVGIPKVGDHSEDQWVNGRITLEWILNK